jgi:hypothetical protein
MSINVYGCGGTGVNIGKKKLGDQYAKYFIDTSDSNLRDIKDESNKYLISNMDGAGKLRKFTYEKAVENINKIMTKFKPSEEVNIVISSITGGSGSVIAPLIVKSLLEKDKNVIYIGVLSLNSRIEVQNAINTLKSVKGISDMTQKPVIMALIESETRDFADNVAAYVVSLFDMMLNKKITEEFDTSDLRNFLYYNNVTSTPVGVGFIEVRENTEFIKEKNTIIASTVLMTPDKDTHSLKGEKTNYLATCIVNDDQFSEVRVDVTVGALTKKIKQYEEIIASYEEETILEEIHDVIVEDKNDHGLVL